MGLFYGTGYFPFSLFGHYAVLPFYGDYIISLLLWTLCSPAGTLCSLELSIQPFYSVFSFPCGKSSVAALCLDYSLLGLPLLFLCRYNYVLTVFRPL
jgi:hypothetical protein